MGEEMYKLHDNGRELFSSARECTPMQRFLYVMAKNHHSEDHDHEPGGVQKANEFRQATNSF
jgi:hypothetical protein